MSLLKGPLSVSWSKTTLAKLARDWPRSGMSKNQYTELMHIQGTRYATLEAGYKALQRELAALKGEG